MSDVRVFHRSTDVLGEGLFFDPSCRRVFWTDIVRSRVYSKGMDDDEVLAHDVEGNPSAILEVRDSTVTFCCRSGLALLDLETGKKTILSENPDTGADEHYRSNDGVGLGGGWALYGTMEFTPREESGGIYLYDGKKTQSVDVQIGIPNGFIRLDKKSFLVADSFTREIGLYELDTQTGTLDFVRCWHDFSSNCFTPDGGCTDYNGKVYFALWDGSGIAVLDDSGNFLEIIDLPVPRPTNCKLTTGNCLLVTTAREGLTQAQIDAAPLSGSVLEIGLR